MEHAYFCKNAKQEHWKDWDEKCTPWLLVSCGVIFFKGWISLSSASKALFNAVGPLSRGA
jgi:hypothetical protein